MIVNTLKIAIRNVFRNRRRTSLTLLSIIFGSVAIIFIGGYIDYSFYGLRETTIRSEIGHIQIYKKGFLTLSGNDTSEKYLLDKKTVASIEKKIQTNPIIVQYAKRLSVVGLISNGDKNAIFVGQGVEPEKESQLSSSLTIESGSDFIEGDGYKILLGKDLAKQLHVKLGNRVTLLTTTYSGSMNAIDFEVIGIISRGVKSLDDKLVRIPLYNAQELLGTNGVDRIVLLLKDTPQTNSVFSWLKKELSQFSIEMKTWEHLADYYFQVRKLYLNIFKVLSFVVLIIIIFSIANTLSMSVMERTSELGTLRAIGTSRLRVLLMFVFEGLVLGVVGGVLGVLSGCFVAFIINSLGGLYMEPPPGFSTGYQIFILISPRILIFSFFVSFISAGISSFLPALKAARLKVVDALRHV